MMPASDCGLRADGFRPVAKHELVLDNLHHLEVLALLHVRAARAVLHPVLAPAHHGDGPRQLPDLAVEPLVLADKHVHTLHPRAASLWRGGVVIRKVDAPNLHAGEGLAILALRQVDGALQLEQGEPGRGLDELRQRVGVFGLPVGAGRL